MSDSTERVGKAEWNMYRDEDGIIDILTMYMSKNMDKMSAENPTNGMLYLKSVMIIYPISSRQTATLAMATAAMIDALDL